MYNFPYYTEDDKGTVVNFLKENSFAIVTGFGENYPVATHLPLEVAIDADGKIILSGHLMRNTDHHKAFLKNDQVLVIFNGPHTYISASWYNTPTIASTWNYMTVHAKGKIKFTDEQGTYNAIKDITNKYESPESAAAFDNIPPEYVQQMMKAIVAFTIEVEQLNNTFKLSQNRDEISHQSIIEQLQKRGDENAVAIAAEMLKRK